MAKAKSKEDILGKLASMEKDCKAIMKDPQAWDIYHDDNWQAFIDNIKEIRAYIKWSGK